jgi:hypothetical protein
MPHNPLIILLDFLPVMEKKLKNTTALEAKKISYNLSKRKNRKFYLIIMHMHGVFWDRFNGYDCSVIKIKILY